ncbi:AraC family transcriptional regulator [Martelella endophytica]|uniref:AraC family transcriptional regulator n=1 Tax=Martelella endophytica TaxID=1486262 RepID=A0A0D5LPC9_MAREN|nr:AraC family transcriptional regulator [Martelella endophytica]AJY46079.1 AraC family transcriptional regulator [Martelella endophytica]
MLAALAERVDQLTRERSTNGLYSPPLGGMHLLRIEARHHASMTIHRPALCLVLQGAKWTMFGGRRLDYHAGQALVTSVEMPGSSQVVGASLDSPYLAFIFELDPEAVRAVLQGMDKPPELEGRRRRGSRVIDCGPPLLAGVARSLDLIDTPDAAAVLFPGIMREICYWLLSGPEGGEIARVMLGSSHAPNVIHAVHALRERFAETVRVEELADIARLSPSAFHRQFKAVTGMTPLQYQKQTRLLEARTLMLSGLANAESAAFRVGYESASQFSREYARMFGAPPRRDIEALSKTAA